MATLPRMRSNKQGISNISSPFSTSPRKLQEMTLPIPDSHHDITSESGVSMKQYEEQLNGMRKENFNLKLRVYFLEEKLGNGAPPAVQGLLEHNVRLQVEVEELRRQLTDKQELLAAAAEAIDVLEQQGSLSTDSVETTINPDTVTKKEVQDRIKPNEETADYTCADSESAGDYLGTTVSNGDLDELEKVRKENRKALQMIKGCMKKIQQQDREIKKLKLDKELVYAHISDSQLEKYEEILKCKDEHIKDLENKIKDFQQNVENVQNDDSQGNLQQMLTRRLQGVAYFLDKLLSHKCVLGEDKKKLAENILEQSLALPVGLKLDESMAPGDFTMDESNLDISQSLKMDDLTMMFGHHVTCSDDNRYSLRKPLRHLPQTDIISESECWSEPDRKVSLARIGLCDIGVAKEQTSDSNKQRARRSRVSYGSRSDEKTTNETHLYEEINQLNKQNEQLERECNDLQSKLQQANQEVDELINQRDKLKSALEQEQSSHSETSKQLEEMSSRMLSMENRVFEIERKLLEAITDSDALRTERQELQAALFETEHTWRRAADEATVQASQAALERARAQHDRLHAEKQLEEARENLARVMEANCQLEIQLTRNRALNVYNDIAVEEVGASEDERPTSSDQGIDSDRLSSPGSPRSLYQENVTLKQKLARTKATLAETLTQLNAANARKLKVQHAICREIHKTHGVLRKARDQLEHQN